MSSSSPSGPRPQAHDVLVKLTVKHPRPELQYPERRVILEQNNTSVLIIGRSSKRFDHLEAKGDNCYFDSPVMSREHAKITVDWYHKKLNIKDIGSLHGTYHNSQRLHPRTLCELNQRDTLKFGIDIQRSNELFPPCTVEVDWEWDHLVKNAQASTQVKARPSFAVPDDSDSSDDDNVTESDFRATLEKYRKIDVQKPDTKPGRLFASSIDLTLDSPMHEPETNGQAGAPIVIDEDIHKHPQEAVGLSAIATEREDALAELDAPHDEEEILQSGSNNHRQIPPVSGFHSDSDESNDESYDDESSSYPDELPSSHDEMVDSCDEDIVLSGSDSEDNSEDDDDEEEEELEADSESGSDVESENEPLGAPSYEQDCPMADDYDYESDAGQPDSTLWADEGASFMCSQALPEGGSSNQPCYIPTTWQPEQRGVQGALSRPFRPMPMPPLPPIVWPTLPVAEQGEQGRPNDFRLPSILNPPDSQVDALHGASNGALPAARSTEYSAHGEAVAPSYTHWQKAYETPKPVAAAVDKDSWALPQHDESSAEALGQLTGKTEFFAAREHNKAIIRRQEQHQDSSQPKNHAPETTDAPAKVSTSEPQPSSASNGATVSESVVEAPKSTNVAESVWSASGDKFLSTPQDFPLSEVRYSSPDFDMTSAYQFHQSKLASNQPSTTDTAQPATSEPDHSQQTSSLRSPKRKAEDISTLVPAEEVAEASTTKVQQQEEISEKDENEIQVTSGQAPPTIPVTAKFIDESAPPPSKRLRSFLTKAGYFLGGGVVTAAGLVTALSAAAPTL
ncbi:FHA domain protein [Colletotrichum tofieldiae]|nr:FHA domain protein [Colletotrichum tofieldiae]GKT68231.1 FHA domain protein [Colletotrichum tofieldiae]